MNIKTVYRVSIGVSPYSVKFEALFMDQPSIADLIEVVSDEVNLTGFELSTLSETSDDDAAEILADKNTGLQHVKELLETVKDELVYPFLGGGETVYHVKVAGVQLGYISIKTDSIYRRYSLSALAAENMASASSDFSQAI